MVANPTPSRRGGIQAGRRLGALTHAGKGLRVKSWFAAIDAAPDVVRSKRVEAPGTSGQKGT